APPRRSRSVRLPLRRHVLEHLRPWVARERAELADQVLHLIRRDVTGTERRGDVGPDGPDRVGHAHAGDGDEPSLAAREAGTQPQVPEDVVEDAGVEVRRVLRRCVDQVDGAEAFDAGGDALGGVADAEVVDVASGKGGGWLPSLVVSALPLRAN